MHGVIPGVAPVDVKHRSSISGSCGKVPRPKLFWAVLFGWTDRWRLVCWGKLIEETNGSNGDLVMSGYHQLWGRSWTDFPQKYWLLGTCGCTDTPQETIWGYEDLELGFDMVKPTRSDPIWGSNHILTLGLEIVHPHKMLGSLVYFCWSKNGMMIP